LVLHVDTAAGAAIPVCEHTNCVFVVGVGFVPVQHEHGLLTNESGASEVHASAAAGMLELMEPVSTCDGQLPRPPPLQIAWAVQGEGGAAEEAYATLLGAGLLVGKPGALEAQANAGAELFDDALTIGMPEALRAQATAYAGLLGTVLTVGTPGAQEAQAIAQAQLLDLFECAAQSEREVWGLQDPLAQIGEGDGTLLLPLDSVSGALATTENLGGMTEEEFFTVLRTLRVQTCPSPRARAQPGGNMVAEGTLVPDAQEVILSLMGHAHAHEHADAHASSSFAQNFIKISVKCLV
jgi:hypothetical protein